MTTALTAASSRVTCSSPNPVDSFFYFLFTLPVSFPFFLSFFLTSLFSTVDRIVQFIFLRLSAPWDHRLCFPAASLDCPTFSFGLGVSKQPHGIVANPLSLSTVRLMFATTRKDSFQDSQTLCIWYLAAYFFLTSRPTLVFLLSDLVICLPV